MKQVSKVSHVNFYAIS